MWAPHAHFPTILCLCAELGLFQETVAVDLYIYCHYVCCLAVAWGCWVIACCPEELCSICLISTPLQLINIYLFAYVCIFHVQVLVMCCFCQLSSLNKKMFSHGNTLTSYIAVYFHRLQWTCAATGTCGHYVGGEGEQELETKCVNKDTSMLRSFLQKTSESTFSKLEIGLI